MDGSAYRPLLVASNSTPKFLSLEECPATGMLTALTFDSARSTGWGVWSSDTGAFRIQIDEQNHQVVCSSADSLVDSTASETKVPWVWSIEAVSAGTVSSGHYLADGTTTGS